MASPVQDSLEHFENLKFNPFEWKDFLLDDSKTGKSFYYNIQAIGTSHAILFSMRGFILIYFSIIHVNIKSDKCFFEKLKDFLSQTGSFFKILCLTKTWFSDRNSESSLSQLP